MRHFITLADLTTVEIERIFSISEDLKTKFASGLRESLLPGRVLALLFEKPSLRTRVSFEAAMTHLGGTAIFLGGDTGFGKDRESLADFGRVLSEYVDAIVIRANKHHTVVEVAEHSTCSVINGLTDFGHPCQAIADLFTICELVGKPQGHTLAWIGDANNVARSLALGCGKLGIKMAMATPKAYQWKGNDLAWIRKQVPSLELLVTEDPREAVADAVAIYTDVWASMGFESEKAVRQTAFAAYQVNAKLMANAQRGAFFMHCLPAHRGEEVTAEVIDGPQSVVVQQAANRMHAQKGLLAWMLGAQG
jgi:ornithine carbamoyltransferase